ncbi:probable cytosolic Fe-S cluster assembly factor AGAP009023 isoform X2 [Prorops nasuta]|uniref:probable cytosolic Fe-S cluster assembly factor AGAP009023 isoform X2 n=1 Tax=Prorops nasuta TaxID=863751 RepID=UPI0034CD4396
MKKCLQDLVAFYKLLILTILSPLPNVSFQECIKPVEIEKSTGSITGAKLKIEQDEAYMEVENQPLEKLKKVEITLADCLACSGCITSAESILISQQSHEELLRIFQQKVQQQKSEREKSIFIVVSLAVQPVLSLAENYKLEPEQCMKKLAGFFYELGADCVLDMTTADDFSLLESAKEFVERFKAKEEGIKKKLPMLASSCPGFICYAEKTHGNFILPYISETKSAQQIMGSIVKYHLAEAKGLPPEQVYHVTLMPCYDKKLEASRDDFYNKERGAKDVDCVITTVEIQQMLNEKNIALNDIYEANLKKPFGSYSNTIDNTLWGHSGSGSGGYADFIFRYAARNIFHENIDTVKFKNLRNPDFQEAILEKDGKILLRFAIVNGFRNIQNIVQKLKRDKCPYDYVEIMACPCGCMNGGAQIRPEENSSNSQDKPRELASKLEEMLHCLPQIDPETNSVTQDLYRTWLGSEHTDKSMAFLHTQYHEIEKVNTALAIKW